MPSICLVASTPNCIPAIGLSGSATDDGNPLWAAPGGSPVRYRSAVAALATPDQDALHWKPAANACASDSKYTRFSGLMRRASAAL